MIVLLLLLCCFVFFLRIFPTNEMHFKQMILCWSVGARMISVTLQKNVRLGIVHFESFIECIHSSGWRCVLEVKIIQSIAIRKEL